MVLVNRAALAATIAALASLSPALAGGDVDRDTAGFVRIAAPTAPMRCVVGFSCAVRLPAGETLVRYAAPSPGWEVAVLDRGGPGRAGELVLRPSRGAQRTNLILVSDVSQYEVILEPALSGNYSRIQFGHLPQVRSVAAVATPAPTLAPTQVIAQTCESMRHAYEFRIEGRAGFKPLGGWSDGRRACFSMPAMTDAPALYRRTANGDEEVGYHTAPGYYLTDVGGERFVFVLGAGKRDELAIAVRR